MPRRVFYRIHDRPDGLFDTVVRIEPDGHMRRDGFVSIAEAEEWVEGLRVLMAALGVPVLRENSEGTIRSGSRALHDETPPPSGRQG